MGKSRAVGRKPSRKQSKRQPKRQPKALVRRGTKGARSKARRTPSRSYGAPRRHASKKKKKKRSKKAPPAPRAPSKSYWQRVKQFASDHALTLAGAAAVIAAGGYAAHEGYIGDDVKDWAQARVLQGTTAYTDTYGHIRDAWGAQSDAAAADADAADANAAAKGADGSRN